MLFAALKDKKALTTVLKENLRLKQLRLNINKQKINKKEHLILLVISFMVDVVSSVLEQLTVVLIVSFYKTLRAVWRAVINAFVKIIKIKLS